MSHNFTKEEFENLSQDPKKDEFYYTKQGNCYKYANDEHLKILESLETDSLKENSFAEDEKIEIENLKENRSLYDEKSTNYGIKFSAVHSGKNIQIHGGGTIASVGNCCSESYAFVGGIIPKGRVYLEFICPISCHGLSFGMATLQEAEDISKIKKKFKSFNSTSRRRVGMDIDYESRVVKFYVEGIAKEETFSMNYKDYPFPCIYFNKKNTNIILNPFARLNNENFPYYLAPDTTMNLPNKSLLSRFVFLANLPKINLVNKMNFIKTHFTIKNPKEENIFIPTNSDEEIKGIVVIKFDKKEELEEFRNSNSKITINNNPIKILEENYLSDLTYNKIFKVIDIIQLAKKNEIKVNLTLNKLNNLEILKNLNSEEDKLIVEFILENFNEMNFLENSISQMLKEIKNATELIQSEKIQKEKTEIKGENNNLKVDYLEISDKMLLIDEDRIKSFARNSQGIFDFEFYWKESKNLLEEKKLKEKKNPKKSSYFNILLEKNELISILDYIPWEKIFNEIIDFRILKCLNNFIFGLKNIKCLNEFLCFPLKKKYARKFVEIVINYLNRLVFIMKEKYSIKNLKEENPNPEMNDFLPFAPEIEETLSEEKKENLITEYKYLSTEIILSLYKTITKISEQIELNLPSTNEKHSSITQCIRWGSAFSRLSTFISCPNLFDKVSVFDLADKGFYIDHSLYNEMKFFGHNFIRSLDFNKIKDQESLDKLINSEFPFGFYNLPNIRPNIELAYSINSLPASTHHDPMTNKSFKIEKYNKSNISKLIVTQSKNGIVNIWDYTLGMNLLGHLNVNCGLKEINNFAKIKELFWAKDFNDSIKSLSEILNEKIFFDVKKDNSFLESENAEDMKKSEEFRVNKELINNLLMMGFPIEASKKALEENENNFDKALEYLFEKQESENQNKQEEEEENISPWNCGECTFLNTKGNLNCEICASHIPPKLLNQHVEQLNKKKEEEKIKSEGELKNREKEKEKIVTYSDCQIKNVHIIINKNDPMAPVLVCAVLFDYIYNKIIISVFKLMINPLIFMDFISLEKSGFTVNPDNKHFGKLEDALSHLLKNYLDSILTLYPTYNKGVNSICYNKSNKFFTLIPIEHKEISFSADSYFDSFAFEGQNFSEIVLLYESLEGKRILNVVKISSKSKVNNISLKSLEIEMNEYNINDYFKDSYPTELKIIKDKENIFIFDQNKIRILNEDTKFLEEKNFEQIGLFRKVEPVFNEKQILISVNIYDDEKKFSNISLKNIDNDTNDTNNSNKNTISNFDEINFEKLSINELEYLNRFLNNEKIGIKINSRNFYNLIKQENPISSGKVFIDLRSQKNLLKNNSINLEFTKNMPMISANINFYIKAKNKSLKSINYNNEELLKMPMENKLENINEEIDVKENLKNFIPLTVSDFKGSQFRQFVNISSILFGKYFLSNYYNPEFLFSHLHEKTMLVNSVVIGSDINSKHGEIPIAEALIFCINDLDSIALAHEFLHFDLNIFSNFVKGKLERKEDFFEWEPVGYYEKGKREYVRTKLVSKRPCKYILLLPSRTSLKNVTGIYKTMVGIKLFAAEGNININEIEKKEYLNNSTEILLKNNSISKEANFPIEVNATCVENNNYTLKNFKSIDINAIIPNTFSDLENTDLFISRNSLKNSTFPEKLISKINLKFPELENDEFELLGFTIELETFKKMEISQLDNFDILKKLDFQILRMNLIDKNNFSKFNSKLCDLLNIEDYDNKKKYTILKFFNFLITKIPSLIEKIYDNLNLEKFITFNILQNDNEQLINIALGLLISIKNSLDSKKIISAFFKILDNLPNMKISFLGLKSFLLLDQIFTEANINNEKSEEMKNLYKKLFSIAKEILKDLNGANKLSDTEIFLKNYLKSEEFYSDEKVFCLNKQVAIVNNFNQQNSIPCNCYGENDLGVIKIIIDMNAICDVKSIKLNFEENESPESYFFKLNVWGSEFNKDEKINEDYKMIYQKNFLDDTWKQLTQYSEEMKTNENYFNTKDFRSIEISDLNYSGRYLTIELNTNQGINSPNLIKNIIIVPEITGEIREDLENYKYSSISDIFDSFISLESKNFESFRKKYKVNVSSDKSKYTINGIDNNIPLVKMESLSLEKKDSGFDKTQIKQNLKNCQNNLENMVKEYTNTMEIFDQNGVKKLKSSLEMIVNLQRNLTLDEKTTNFNDLYESKYFLLKLFFNFITNIMSQSKETCKEVFNSLFSSNDEMAEFAVNYIDSLILNSTGEFKVDFFEFLEKILWPIFSENKIEEKIFQIIFDKFIIKEHKFRSVKVLLESLSKINFSFNLILKNLIISFEKNYPESELSNAFYSISSLILLLIMKLKNEKENKNVDYSQLVEISLKIITSLTNNVKFVKEVDDILLAHSINLLQESFNNKHFKVVNTKKENSRFEFMLDTLFSLWDHEFIRNKLFTIINNMIDPLNILEKLKNPSFSLANIEENELNLNEYKYTHYIYEDLQNFALKFYEKIIENNYKNYTERQNVQIVCLFNFSCNIIKFHKVLLTKIISVKGNVLDLEDSIKKIHIKNHEILLKFIKFFGNFKSNKLDLSIENKIWDAIFILLEDACLQFLLKDNLLENIIFDILLTCKDELKDMIYTKIIKLFKTVYQREKTISEIQNCKLTDIYLRLLENAQNSEKIILPFINQFLEIIACGESPFTEKKNANYVIPQKYKQHLFIKISEYLIRYINYTSVTGATSSNKIVYQHLSIGCSLMHILDDNSESFYDELEINEEINSAIRNYLMFITFNQYAETSNAPPTVLKISKICIKVNKIIDSCCKHKKLIEIVLTEFMDIVRKIDEKLINKIKSSEISIKKGLVISKKLYFSLDLILNKCLYNDEITKFFAFNLQGFKFFVERVNRHKKDGISKSKKLNLKLNQELLDYLNEESKNTINSNKNESEEGLISDIDELNSYEEFALLGKLSLTDDPINGTMSNTNWSLKKKGQTSYILHRDIKGNTYYEDTFNFKMANSIELKDAYIGFTYSPNVDKSSGIIPSVFLIAGETLENMNYSVKLERMNDQAYSDKSVITYGFNFFASDPRKIPLDEFYIENLFNQLGNCKAKYFKFIVRRPVITANENSYTNKSNLPVAICLNHVSLFGTKLAKMEKVIEYIQEEEKNVSIKIISKIFTAEFIDTLKYFAKDDSLIEKIKEVYDVYESHIGKHAEILSNILINVSKYVFELGEWLLNRLLNVDNTEIHAKLAVEITRNSPIYVNDRVNKYLNFILNELDPDSPIFFSNNTDNKLQNLGKFADYLTVILNGLNSSPFNEKEIKLDFDMKKLIKIIKNLNKYSVISSDVNKLITILLIPSEKLQKREFLDVNECLDLLHNYYVETNYYDYAFILSYLVSNNSQFEKVAIKKNYVVFYFEEFLDQVNKGIRGRNMLFLMQIIKNFSFSKSIVDIIIKNDYDFKILISVKNKDLNLNKYKSILINNNVNFLENLVTFLKNSLINCIDKHSRLAELLIEDLEYCKYKYDKIYANYILMPLLRMEESINVCLHPVDTFFNNVLSTYCNIGQVNYGKKIEKTDNKEFLLGSTLSKKCQEKLQKSFSSHQYDGSYKFNYKQFSLKYSSFKKENNSFEKELSNLDNILFVFYDVDPNTNKPKENSATLFFIDAKISSNTINDNDLSGGSIYDDVIIDYTDKNAIIQIDNDNVILEKLEFEYGEVHNDFEYNVKNITIFEHGDPMINIDVNDDSNNAEVKIKDFKSGSKITDKSTKYFEIYSTNNLLETKKSTDVSAKISASRFIDSSGNLDLEKVKNLKYYKKSNPLLVTRNNPIFEIPSNVTIKHIKDLFGSDLLKFKFLTNQIALNDNMEISEIVKKYSNEHNNILDLCYDINELLGNEINSNESLTYIKNYEPNLPIYKSFEKLDGIIKIIGVLKNSILSWKNKEAKENWGKWVDDVEKFSVLPTFFSTLIRHQKCFNVIFDLLCGLHDQENYSKEIIVETSNYVYEIINNTFIATESSMVRIVAIEKGIFSNILSKLEILTREKPRKFIIEEISKEEEKKKDIPIPIPPPSDNKKGKKGVGYGSDHTGDNKAWDINSYLENKKTNSEQIASIIKLLSNFFKTKELKINETLDKIILESVILPVLESAYRGGTLLELAKQDTLYYAYLDLTLKLAENKNLIPYLLDISKDYKPAQTESIFVLLGQLNDGAKIFTNCINKGSNKEKTSEERLALKICSVYESIGKKIKEYQVNLSGDKDYSEILKLPVEKSYALLMRELSFNYMSMKDKNDKIVHYYSGSYSKENSPPKLIRLAQEYADLSRALPCEHTNSIFVRVDKDNMDLLKVLIMGSAGTPYGHGAFEFDVYFDNSYPTQPPKVTLVTTGAGTVRFNPNLYSNGKVCLSLLGTWRGNSSENWDQKISTFLQVLISIQSIIMSELVYFNEPSCEAEMGKPEGEARNEAYSNIVKYCNMKYAMVEMIKKPSKGFEDVIKRHFYLKKKQILEETATWIEKSRTTKAKYASFSYDHNPTWAQKMSTQEKFTKMMEEIYVELEHELNILPIPSDLKQKQEESEKNNANKKENKKFDFVSLENVDMIYENENFNEKEINVDDDAVKDRWSRYIGAMGIDAVKRQASSSIFVSGASGLGVEISKNLVLSGCKRFILHDTKNTNYLDLSSQFFLSEEDIDMNRAEKTAKKLQQLNFYVKVSANTNKIPLTEEELDKFGMNTMNVVILTECDYETAIAVNKYCRKRKINFIWADIYGVYGRVINDFGDKFTINDVDGEDLKDCMIKNITNEKEGLVTVLDGTRHNFQDGDEIILSEVVGMNGKSELISIDVKEKKLESINGTKHVVKVKNPQNFFIGDTTKYGIYERNGMAKQIKTKKEIEFKEIDKILFDSQFSGLDENMSISDFTKIGNTNPIHIGFQALNEFVKENKNLPEIWNFEDFKTLMKITENISKEFKYELTNRDKKLIAFLSFTSRTQFSPLAAFFGGLIAQEAVKAITGKFMPIKQLFYYDSIEVIPGFELKEDDEILSNLEKLVKDNNFQFSKTRIDGIMSIVGKEILQKIRKMKILVVGAGAIGCELLKNFSLLEVGTNLNESKSKDQEINNGIIVTDPDIIEVSNLNRQFLFREKHLRLPKSSTAAAAVIQMNKNLKNNIYANLEKVCEETEHVFTDKFFQSLSLVANALDNIKARRYVDGRCVTNRIPLLESGTLGPKGHVQVIAPFKTESYSSQQDPEVNTDIPQCTLKMFPEEALHCIEWARDLFGKLFSQKPKNFNRVLEEGCESQDLKITKQVLNMLKNKPTNFDDCIKYAREKFQKLFTNNIKQLMYSYPIDKKNKDGSLFWNLPKRAPDEVIFDPKDSLHNSFISACACLLATQYKIKIPYDNPRKESSKIDMAEKANKVLVKEFKINTLKAKELEKQVEKEKKQENEENKNEKELDENETQDDKTSEFMINELKNLFEKNKLNKYNEMSEKEKLNCELISEEFEKDNDANFHIDIIYAMTNLRCRNYRLDEMDWLKVKIKAGKIIPALATTTASIAGLQALELVKLVKNMEIEHVRNSFLNLAIPFLQASEPGLVGKNKLTEDVSVTLWDRWEFKPEQNNLEKIYKYLSETYGLFPRDCFIGKKAVFLYIVYLAEDKKAARDEIMKKDLHKLLNLNTDESYIDLTITFTKDEKSEEYIKNTPTIRIFFK